MTACRLRDEETQSPLYAVIGACTADHAVFHVGVLERSCGLVHDQKVAVFHMAGPPAKIELPGTMNAHAVGWIEGLTDDERAAIADWLEQIRIGIKNRSVTITYTAYPASEYGADRVNGRGLRRRLSCAGFVCCCYLEALGLTIVAAEAELPEVDLIKLQQVWGDVARHPAAPRYRRGPPPWRVLLPSYLFQALAVDRAALPYRPARAYEFFLPEGILALRRAAWTRLTRHQVSGGLG